MLSYRHAFHAGNHADVFKHWVLVLLLEALRRKDKPFFVLDTHGGAGRYDLQAAMALKNAEFEGGVGRLWGSMADIPSLAGYAKALQAGNPGGSLRWYPGSPRLIRHFLRTGDRLVATELHPRDQLLLQREFEGDSRVRIEGRDGYDALKALLPPRERRGLIHLDPAYERKDEARRLALALTEGYRRWASGLFAIWYPIHAEGAEVPRRIHRLGIPKTLNLHYQIGARAPGGLVGSGMILINPPYGLEETVLRDFRPLVERLSIGQPVSHAVERWLP